MSTGYSSTNPLDNAVIVLAAQLMAPLMPTAITDEQVYEAAERALWAAKALLTKADWSYPDA